MPQLIRAGVAALLGVAVATWPAGQASGVPASCTNYDQFGTCIVTAGTGGQGGGIPAPAGPEAPTSTASCTWNGAAIPCEADGGLWLQSSGCYVSPVSEPPPVTAAVWEGHTDGAIYQCIFPGSASGTGGVTFWAQAPPAGPAAVDPAQLARQALQSIQLPTPSAGRYPAGDLPDGRPYTVVNAHTWFWTDAASWTPRTARADAGGVWAEVTVSPSRLTFTPGDGGPSVSCPGPGVPWATSDGVWAPSPMGCDYRYLHTSAGQPDQLVTATYGTTWDIAWTSSTGATGVLPDLTTTTQSRFAVAEVQSVVTQ